MAHKMLRPFAMMGRASGVTRDALIVKLARLGSPTEVSSVVDEVMALSEEKLNTAMSSMIAAQEAARSHIDSGSGSNVDSRGFDEADRRTENLIVAALGEPDDKLN